MGKALKADNGKCWNDNSVGIDYDKNVTQWVWKKHIKFGIKCSKQYDCAKIFRLVCFLVIK